MLLLKLVTAGLLLAAVGNGQPKINQVMGMPEVYCEMDKLKVVARTARPFWGRIFAKGRSADPGCAKHFQVGGTSHPELEVKLAACGMLRERKLDPKPGLMETIVVVISFHSMLLTKKDRAYSVQCYYEQQHLQHVNGAVTVMLVMSSREMSTIPLGIIRTQSARCHYSVHHHGIDGPEARVAEIGQKLYHMWTCEGPPDLKMLVKNCAVSNGQSEVFSVVDDVGCAVDPTILPDLTYMKVHDDTLHDHAVTKAYVAADAFKFSDNSQMQFSCTIQLCSETRGDSDCLEMSPPVCYDHTIGQIIDKHTRKSSNTGGDPSQPTRQPSSSRVNSSRGRKKTPIPTQPATTLESTFLTYPLEENTSPTSDTPTPTRYRTVDTFDRPLDFRTPEADFPPSVEPDAENQHLDIQKILQIHEAALNRVKANGGEIDIDAHNALFSGLVIDTDAWRLNDNGLFERIALNSRPNGPPKQAIPFSALAQPPSFLNENTRNVPLGVTGRGTIVKSEWQPVTGKATFRDAVSLPPQTIRGRRKLRRGQNVIRPVKSEEEFGSEIMPEQETPIEAYYYGRQKLPVAQALSSNHRVKRYFDEVDVHAPMLNVLDPQTTTRHHDGDGEKKQTSGINGINCNAGPDPYYSAGTHRQLLNYTSSSICLSQWWFAVCMFVVFGLVGTLLFISSTLLIRQAKYEKRFSKPQTTFFDDLMTNNRRQKK